MAFDPKNFPKNTSETFGTYDPKEEENARERCVENLRRLNEKVVYTNNSRFTSATNRPPLNYDLLLNLVEQLEKERDKARKESERTPKRDSSTTKRTFI
jgi:hypothetical protein